MNAPLSKMALPVDSADPQFAWDNPMWLTAQVMLYMTGSHAAYLATMTARMQELTQDVEALTAPLTTLDNAKGSIGPTDATASATLATSVSFVGGAFGTVPGETMSQYQARLAAASAAQADMITQAQQLLAACGQPAATPDTSTNPVIVGGMKVEFQLASPPATGFFKLTATNSVLDDLLQDLHGRIDDANAEAQQSQLDLQTIMGRFNGALLTSTSAVKRYEADMQAITSNLGR